MDIVSCGYDAFEMPGKPCPEDKGRFELAMEMGVTEGLRHYPPGGFITDADEYVAGIDQENILFLRG